MSKFMLNGKPYGVSTNYASAIACADIDGNESNVQNELNGIYEKSIYSTEEIIVGKWIDGKPIYRKTLTGTLGSDLYTVVIDPGLIDTIVNTYGIVIHPSTEAQMQLGCYLNERNYCGFYVGGENICSIFYSEQYATGSYKITVEYTKK